MKVKINKSSMLNDKVIFNFSKITLRYLFLPSIILLFLILFFISINSFSIDGYINIQKELFFNLNKKLSYYSSLQYNLTQFGDILISFPLVSILIIYAPNFWEKLITSSILALFISFFFKKIFSVPRPASVFSNDNFTILGKALVGKTSLPSGHSIATFIVISSLLFALMPKEIKYKFIWSFFIIIIGLIISFSRVAVGAHYPLDVVVGIVLGYMIVVLSILINKKHHWLKWIYLKKIKPILVIIMLIWGCILVYKIKQEDLIIFYLSLFSLIITFTIVIYKFITFKKRNLKNKYAKKTRYKINFNNWIRSNYHRSSM